MHFHQCNECGMDYQGEINLKPSLAPVAPAAVRA